VNTSVSAQSSTPRRQDVEPLVRLRSIEKSFDHGAGRFHVLRASTSTCGPASSSR
jgi:hypothetical protein